jgi:hypothetical protein
MVDSSGDNKYKIVVLGEGKASESMVLISKTV